MSCENFTICRYSSRIYEAIFSASIVINQDRLCVIKVK